MLRRSGLKAKVLASSGMVLRDAVRASSDGMKTVTRASGSAQEEATPEDLAQEANMES